MPGLDPARAGRHERARALDLDHADAADVDRREVLEVAERRRVDARAPGRPRGSSRPRGTRTGRAVDRRARRCGCGRSTGDGAHAAPPSANGSSVADRRLDGARRPSGRARRSRRRASPGRSRRAGRAPRPRPPIGRPRASRCSSSSWRTVPTRQGTHWPHDSSRKKAAIRSRIGAAGRRVSSKTMHHARAERRADARACPRRSAARRARPARRTRRPRRRAGPPGCARPPATPPASAISSPQRRCRTATS